MGTVGETEAAEERNQRDIDSGCLRERAISREALRLASDKEGVYYPFDKTNILRVIEEISDEGAESIGKLLSGGQYERVGGRLARMARERSLEQARPEAVLIIDRSCHVCFGEGCPKCDDRGDNFAPLGGEYN